MKKIVKSIGVLLFWLLVWYALYLIVNRDILIVSPLAVGENLLSLIQTKRFYQTILFSAKNVFLGFSFAMIFGTGLGILTYRFSILNTIFTPAMSVMKATPVASFIITALFFMSSKNLPILVSFLMVSPLVWSNMVAGLQSVDKQLVEMATIFKIPFRRQLKNIYLPSTVPCFYSSCKTGFGYAWKSAITAEVIASPALAIGQYIGDSKIYLDTLNLYSWTIVAIFLSIMTEKIFISLVSHGIKHFYPTIYKDLES